MTKKKKAKDRARHTREFSLEHQGARLMIAAMEASVEYDTQVKATPEGRASERLRTQAHGLVGRRDLVDAHELFLKAAQQHSPSDNDAAATACWFDLGISFMNVQTGVRLQNLTEAEQLLRRAENAPTRRTDVRRHVLSLDGLGKVLRIIAELSDNTALRDEGVRHLRKAVEVARKHGLADLLANGLTHLGNALVRANKVDDAIRAHEESIRVVKWIAREMPPLEQMMTTGLDVPLRRLNLVAALSLRGRDRDFRRALELVDVVITEKDPVMAARACLIGYKIAQQLGGPHAAQAKSYLEPIDIRLLNGEEQRQLLTALADEGEGAKALAIARRGIGDAFEERNKTIADPDADRCAVEAQRFSRLAAEFLVSDDRPVEAFLALENTAALRFLEETRRYYYSIPKSPVSRALTELHNRANNLARILDDLALRIAGIKPATLNHMLDDVLDELLSHLRTESIGEFEWEGSANSIERIIANVKVSSVPSETFREHSRLLQKIGASIAFEMGKLDPAFFEQMQSKMNTETSLEGLFAEHPEMSLLRLSADADSLLAIAVWMEEGEVRGASRTFPVPAGTIDALFALTRETLEEAAEKQQAQAELDSFLEAIDLSGVLPDAASHVVILPSLIASFVPWAASGPRDHLLIDWVDAVSYLPNITPLLMRQAPRSSRSGSLVVVPGAQPVGAGTKYHGLAFGKATDGEIHLSDVNATKSVTAKHAATADTVSFFAHGNYGPNNRGAIGLADGEFFPDEHPDVWRGMERAELWACRSGVNISYDPLTPWVDEAFGLDVSLHHLGVRSTIGTFWNVPDLVTALLVRKYRTALTSGRNAPQALADAQRWWRTEGLAQARAALESKDPLDDFRKMAASLGLADRDADTLVDGMLGPVERERQQLSPDKVDSILQQWASPTAWAGFRFLGVSERRPQGEPPSTETRALTEEEHATIEKVLQRPPETAPSQDLGDQLIAATSIGGVWPSADQAITTARLYGVRRSSSCSHNLVRGLAWIHEALATPTSGDVDRTRLQNEAAWFWFELATAETPLKRCQLRPNRDLFGRAASAVDLLPAGPDRTVLTLGLAVALGLPTDLAVLHAAWEEVRAEPVESVEGLRLRTLLVSLHLAADTTPRQLAIDLVNEPFLTADAVVHHWRARYAVVLVKLLSHPALEDLPTWSLPPAQYLPHALFAERCALEGQAIATHDDLPEGAMREVVSNDLTLMEAGFWGYRRDHGVPAWLATGSPGAGWRRFVGAALGQTFRIPRAQLDGARYFIASIHLGANLRIAPWAARAVLHGFTNDDVRSFDLAAFTHLRERLLEALLDAAAIGWTAPESDVFFRSRAEVAAAGPLGPEHLTSWNVGEMLDSRTSEPADQSQNRVAGFDIEQHLLELDTKIRRMAPAFANTAHEVQTIEDERFRDLFNLSFGPPRDLEILQRELATLPPDVAVLGLLEGEQGELLIAATWNEDGRTKQAIHCAKDLTGAKAAYLLSQVQHAGTEGIGEMRGWSSTHAEAWSELCKRLDEPLGAVVRWTGRRALRVLAPHTLRSLPWVGLTAGGVPLRSRVSGVALLPFLGFEKLHALRPTSPTPNTFCVLGGTPSHGETRFGAVVVESLRRLFPGALVGEPPTSPGTPITEVSLIDEHHRGLQVLRLYGTGWMGTVNASTECLVLSHNRMLSPRNLDGMTLPACECVELWAATEGDGASSRQATGRDTFPALVRSFLTAGAGGVVDLAWPVPDLVKALVCERFGLLRRQPVRAPEALGRAVSEIGTLLAEWKSASSSFASLAEALAWLDTERRENARSAGLTAGDVASFAPLAEPQGPSATTLIEVCCQPVHLAAFRYWGA